MTTNNIKEAASLIWAEIEKAQNILLHCHVNPDFDSVSSALSMGSILESVGKKVTIIKGDSELPSAIKYLPGSEKIVSKNYFEVDLSNFDLFIILDSADEARVTKLGDLNFPPHLKTVVIDHHVSNPGFADINLIASHRPATAQILFELFTEWRVNISPEVAGCLMVGLHADTGGFKHRGTDEDTFSVASALAHLCPNFSVFLNEVYGNNSLNRFRFMGMVMSRVETLFDGRVALAQVSHDELVEFGFKKEEIKNTGLSSMMAELEGVEMSFLLVEYDPGSTGISARSRNGEKYDLATLLAPLGLGGGGHKAAAGVYIAKPLDEAKLELMEALTRLLQ